MQADIHFPECGSPLLGEPLAIEFVNTVHAQRGRTLDALTGRGQLARWFLDHREQLATRMPEGNLHQIDERDLNYARSLRDAVRALVAARVHERAPDPFDLTELNRACGLASRWPTLHWEPGSSPSVRVFQTGTPVVHAFVEIAYSAVDLLTNFGDKLRACQGPGCVLFFYGAHPRREWCSAACGNRARVARHHERLH